MRSSKEIVLAAWKICFTQNGFLHVMISIKQIYKIVSGFLTFVNLAEEFTLFRIPDHILFLDTFDFIRQKKSGKVGILISKHKISGIFKDVNDIHGFEKLVTRQVLPVLPRTFQEFV